jgi:serine protease Do
MNKALIAMGCVVAMSAAARAQDEDAKILKAFESRWQKAADKAASVVVSIKVEREETREPKAAGRPVNNPMTDGGVFKKPPDKVTYVCDEDAVEEAAAGKCGKCEKDLRKAVRSTCTGTILEADGVIATSYFNMLGKITKLTVTTEGGKEYDAKLLGYNAGADLAVLKINAKNLPVLPLADVGKLKTGMNVVVLGRAPDGRALTLNEGILSAPQRNMGFHWQFDALTNYGNVGGPLVDTDGKLIGISCKIDVKSSGSVGQNSGISFACPLDQMAKILPDLKLGKSTVNTGKPFMGIMADVEANEVDGVKLRDIVKGGGAERAGLKAGDVVLEFDGVATKVFDDLRGMIEKKAIGDQFRVKVRRGEEEFEFTGTLGERPADQ